MLAAKNQRESEEYFPGHVTNDTMQPVDISVRTDLKRKEQFEELFIPLIDRLHNMALRITRNPDDAEDLVQETYLKAYRFFDNFDKNTNTKAWIMTIMMNTFRTKYRKSQKEPITVNYNAVENYLSSGAHDTLRKPANKSETRNIDNITEYMKSVVSDDIINALESVPVRFRMPVLLSDAEQFNYQEISEILGVNIGTVKSRIFRGRKLLKKSLYEFAVKRGIYRRSLLDG
ncbi:MAG: sigma-70 family RNA polymerase sigma factor [Candidatus Zixiibacteriota bacterium]|nr:MAG: sigma-70 family RNA polymerase sigma factor [candidate division Zixibacteria bacterium]